jgi:hypothetical protein
MAGLLVARVKKYPENKATTNAKKTIGKIR